MLKVTLDIYSGRRNPTWMLSEREEQRLLDLVRSKPNAIISGETMVSKLGYRGFIVRVVQRNRRIDAANIPLVFRVWDDLEAAQWLIHTSHKVDADIQDSTRDIVVQSTMTQPNGHVTTIDAGQPTIQGSLRSCSSNLYYGASEIVWWNDSHVVKNNCYNFASNWRTDTYAKPGRASGRESTQHTCADVSAAVRRDGYADSCRTQYNITICLVIWPNEDYHFYRKYTSTGVWGHKLGGNDAKTTDESNRVITNPETCNRGDYTTFCEYFYASDHIAVR